MGRRGLVCAVAVGLGLSSVAAADGLVAAADHMWPSVPRSRGPSLELRITDHLTELGNLIGQNLNVLSDDFLGLKVDGRARRARLRLGTGTGSDHYLTLNLDSDWYFGHGKARISARVDLGIGEHLVHLELPDFEMAPASYRGEQGVELRLPLFERKF